MAATRPLAPIQLPSCRLGEWTGALRVRPPKRREAWRAKRPPTEERQRQAPDQRRSRSRRVGQEVCREARTKSGPAGQRSTCLLKSPVEWAADRLEAVKKRAGELRDGDPRKQKALEGVKEAQQLVKETGGRTRHKLHFNLLDGDQELDKKKKALELAIEEHRQAQERSAAALTEEGRAEARVQVCMDEVKNCESRNCHWALQAASEAAMGQQGYNDLEAAVHYVGTTLAAHGAMHAREMYELVAGFVYKFKPQEYSSKEDALLQELESVETASVLTEPVGGSLGWLEQETQAEAVAVRRESALPAAFETSIATRVSTRFALLQPTGEGEQKGRSTEGNKAEGLGTKGQVEAETGRRPLEGSRVGARRGRSQDLGRRVCTEVRRSTSLANKGRDKSRSRSSKWASEVESRAVVAIEASRGRSWDRHMDIREDGRAAQKRVRSGEEKEEAKHQDFFCQACGNGPFPLPGALCGCGGNLCKDCEGANVCMRCNSDRSAVHRRVLC